MTEQIEVIKMNQLINKCAIFKLLKLTRTFSPFLFRWCAWANTFSSCTPNTSGSIKFSIQLVNNFNRNCWFKLLGNFIANLIGPDVTKICPSHYYYMNLFKLNKD